MGMVDVVVLPYQEVGQASSGPMSIAVEMGARVVASRNHAFMQFDRFNPGRVRFFDIGNHLELAQRVRQALRSEAPVPEAVTSTETNRDVYRRAHDVLTRTGGDV